MSKKIGRHQKIPVQLVKTWRFLSLDIRNLCLIIIKIHPEIQRNEGKSFRYLHHLNRKSAVSFGVSTEISVEPPDSCHVQSYCIYRSQLHLDIFKDRTWSSFFSGSLTSLVVIYFSSRCVSKWTFVTLDSFCGAHLQTYLCVGCSQGITVTRWKRKGRGLMCVMDKDRHYIKINK